MKSLLAHALDWRALCSLAEEHCFLGLVGQRLQACLKECTGTDLPVEILAEWNERRRAQSLSSLRLTAELSRLFDAFSSANLEALVTKGPVLSQRCYGDPGARQYSDLDLIVRDRDILRVTQLMLGLGYTPRISETDVQAKKAAGEYAFRQPGTKLLVEFHTERTFRYHPRPLPVENLFARRAGLNLDGREIPALAPEDELILICIHAAKHYWERLSHIADVAAFLSNQPLDWDRVQAAAAEVDAERMLYVGIRLAKDLLDAPIPEAMNAVALRSASVERLVRRISQWLPTMPSGAPSLFERALFRMRMRGGIVLGPAYLLRIALSPTEEDWSPEAESRRGGFLHILSRPFRLARKYSRAEASYPAESSMNANDGSASKK
ncbi:MAG TPA: nucleotidyltransferase family protein [Candidatus Acidoferrum sp.]|nr:nucleotidyltransferase family protein [Candidatus Acidoferrum sp.]